MKGDRLFCAAGRNVFVRVLAGVLISGFCLLVQAGDGLADNPDKVVVVVNGQQLKAMHFDRVMEEILPASSFHGGVSDEKKAVNRQRAIDRLIEEELLYQEAKRLGIKPDRKAVKQQLEESVKRVGGKDRFKEALRHYGVTQGEFERALGAPDMVKKVLEKKVDSQATVSDSELRAYYDENSDTHFKLTMRRFRHIMLKTDPGDPATWDAIDEKARDILKRIRDGADFEEMARNFSEGVRKDKGGDTGFMAKGEMLSELELVGWKMEQGDVSDVIQTIYGFHIIKLEEGPIDKIIPFEVARDQIESLLVSSKKQALRKLLVDGLREKAAIKVVDE